MNDMQKSIVGYFDIVEEQLRTLRDELEDARRLAEEWRAFARAECAVCRATHPSAHAADTEFPWEVEE
jgi:hypothetical protein